MISLTCIIADDEPLALELLHGYVEKTPFLELVQACSSAIETLEALNQRHIDLLFLDIQMPNLSGIELARSLKEGPMIVFTTAFEQYAIEGYKVNAIDYLLKPFSFEEFLAASNKAKTLYQEKLNISAQNKKDYIFVKADYKVQKIDLANILYIEGIKDYVKIHLHEPEGKFVMSLISMKSVEAQLPQNQFMRIHRSFIVNLTKIKTIDRSRIVFGNVYIPISDKYKGGFQEFIKDQFLN